MFARFILYGLFGWCAELLWTSLRFPFTAWRTGKAIDWKLPGRTYLWMFPVYAAGGLLFEVVHAAIVVWPWWARGLVYMTGCYIIEYAAGWTIRRLTGSIPWDYSRVRFHLHRIIRFDFAPLWFGFGLLLEWLEMVFKAAVPEIHAGFG